MEEIPEGVCRLNASAIVLLVMALAEITEDKETFEMLRKKYGEPETLAKDAEVICIDP
jgi:hypothetical protein